MEMLRLAINDGSARIESPIDAGDNVICTFGITSDVPAFVTVPCMDPLADSVPGTAVVGDCCGSSAIGCAVTMAAIDCTAPTIVVVDKDAGRTIAAGIGSLVAIEDALSVDDC